MTMSLDQVKSIGNDLLVSRAHVNNCSNLISLLSSALSSRGTADVEVVVEGIRFLQAFFIPLSLDEPNAGVKRKQETLEQAEIIYKTWVQQKYLEFTSLLLSAVVEQDSIPALQTAALEGLIELIQGDDLFNMGLCRKLWEAMLNMKNVHAVLGMIAEHFKKLKFCYMSVSSIKDLLLKRHKLHSKGEHHSCEVFLSNSFEILCIPQLTHESFRHEENINEIKSLVLLVTNGLSNETKIDTSKKANLRNLKRKLSTAWLIFLQFPLPLTTYKKVLSAMSKTIIPNIKNPIQLSDFLTKSYDLRGLYSVMSLGGLYILMTKHGLEYPDFYNKLYQLLEPSIFAAKYRSRFFKLMDACLKSPLLPAYLAAAFAKRLSYLSLTLSPAGSLVVIAMIHNLLRRHPSINALVHRKSSTLKGEENGESSTRGGVDPFVASSSDPEHCNAIASSLWEIESLRRHYCPAVSRFVATLETDLTVRSNTSEVNMSDFSGGSYSSIFHEEVGRRVKQVPLAFYQFVPTSLFSEDDAFAGWVF